MITAELEHNPYLLETKIKFNNQVPRINSLVEKYLKERLQTWIKDVPSIFHDEMNGYDFTLEFSGTKTDFEELKKSFALAGVSSKQVNFVLKKQIQDRKVKLEKLADLLNWLSENQNGRFDYKQFREDHEDLFEGAYPFIVLQGRSLDVSVYDNSEIAVEKIDKVEELDNTDLTSTPILVCISRSSLPDLQKNLRYLNSRIDVIPEQIFFYISQDLNMQKVIRLIQDLGVAKPRIVKSINSPSIVRFMELYPYTDYVYEAAGVLKGQLISLSEELDRDNKENEIKHSETYQKLKEYDEAIANISNAGIQIGQKGELTIPDDWLFPKKYMLDRIKSWRKKKVKITSDEEAKKEAEEFNREVQQLFISFCETLQAKALMTRDDLTNELYDNYMTSGIDKQFAPKLRDRSPAPPIQLWSITDDLLKLKEERLVEQKEDIVLMLFKQDNSHHGYVREVTYMYQEWREFAMKTAEKAADEQIRKFLKVITQDFMSDCLVYLEVLTENLNAAKEARKKEVEMLSGEEKKLQEDNEWLNEFKEKLDEIERG